MTQGVSSYDKDLPEVPGHLPWERLTARLVKDAQAATGWCVADGRRESRLLLDTQRTADIRSGVE